MKTKIIVLIKYQQNNSILLKHLLCNTMYVHVKVESEVNIILTRINYIVAVN